MDKACHPLITSLKEVVSGEAEDHTYDVRSIRLYGDVNVIQLFLRDVVGLFDRAIPGLEIVDTSSYSLGNRLRYAVNVLACRDTFSSAMLTEDLLGVVSTLGHEHEDPVLKSLAHGFIAAQVELAAASA